MRTSLLRLAGLLFASSLFAAAPTDLDDSYQALKDAVAKKDVAQVRKLAPATYALAHAAATAPAPAEESEKTTWKQLVEYGRGIEQYIEYALSASALSAPTPQLTIELLAMLEQQNPKSRYLDDAYAAYIVAMNKSGAAAQIPAMAEKALAHFPENEDLLLVLADHYLNTKRTAQANQMAERLLNVIKRHPQPEVLSPSDWAHKKTACLTRAYWIAGLTHAERNEYLLADTDLRAALPLVKGNEAMLAPALFHLAVANYHLGRQAVDRNRILEAARYSEQCAAIRGPFQRQAWTNAHLMKAEADKLFARK